MEGIAQLEMIPKSGKDVYDISIFQYLLRCDYVIKSATFNVFVQRLSSEK